MEDSTNRGRFGAWRAGRSSFRLQLLSVFSLSVAFITLAASLLVVTNIDAVRERWSRAGRATIYLKDGARDADVAGLSEALSQTQGVSKVHKISSEEARREMATSDEAMQSLPVAAFPASIELSFTQDISDTQLQEIALKLRALPAVDSVETYERWTERLGSLLGGGVTAAACLAIIVLAAVVSVVSSTMRLLMQRRKIEIEVLKLVGATDKFVRRPFVAEGATQGALGAALALGILGALFLVVRGRFDQQLANLLGVSPSFLPWYVALGMVALGAILGAGTATISLRKLSSV